jgi:hypothetical protein
MYTTNDELSTIHFLNDQNIVQELSVAEEGKLNPIPSLSLLNKVNDDLEKRIDDGSKTASTISLSVENLSGFVKTTIDEHSLSIGNLSGLLDATITSCDDISKRIDGLDATVSADKGNFITSITQKDGKLESVEFTQIDDNYVKEISEEKITGLTDDLKNLSANYVKKAGDSISNLTVDNDLTVDGYISSNYVKTVKDEGIVITGAGADKHGKVKIDIENAADNVMIGDVSFSGHIKNAINELNYETVTLRSKEIIDSIGETNGTIFVKKRNLAATDIPTLPQEKIEGLTADYLKTKDFETTLESNTDDYFKGRNTGLSVVTGDDLKKYIVLTNGKTRVSVNVDSLIINGIVESVTVEKSGGEKYPEKDGPYLAITQKKPDGTLLTSYTSIKTLIHVYESGEGIIVDGLTIKINDDVVTKRDLFNPVATYVSTL